MAQSAVTTVADPLVCRCLQVRQSQIEDCVNVMGAQSVQDVREMCGAGGGCNCCHRRIRDFIARQQAPKQS